MNIFPPIRLNFTNTQWTIRHLIENYTKNYLNLNPHYQRNAIWSPRMQRQLIDTIHKGYPLPTFFLRETNGGLLEVVDGQQRIRTILGYWNGEFQDSQKLILNESIKKFLENKDSINSLLDYSLSISILQKGVSDIEVENFYVLVNSSGMRLNRSELKKAEFYNTRLLELSTRLSENEIFANLSLFSEKSEDRMNDVDFLSELIAFLKFGFTDKKEKVDELFKTDISSQEFELFEKKMLEVLGKISTLNEMLPINKTRLKQKGDFYTLFAFIEKNPELTVDFLKLVYDTIIRLSPHIRPSQEDCDPLTDYALNCVSQSNSKNARQNRHAFFQDLFLNFGETPSPTQIEIAEYLHLPEEAFYKFEGKLILNVEYL